MTRPTSYHILSSNSRQLPTVSPSYRSRWWPTVPCRSSRIRWKAASRPRCTQFRGCPAAPSPEWPGWGWTRWFFRSLNAISCAILTAYWGFRTGISARRAPRPRRRGRCSRRCWRTWGSWRASRSAGRRSAGGRSGSSGSRPPSAADSPGPRARYPWPGRRCPRGWPRCSRSWPGPWWPPRSSWWLCLGRDGLRTLRRGNLGFIFFYLGFARNLY